MVPKLFLGDCAGVMRGMEAQSVDAIVTDPPYGTQADKDGYGRRDRPGGIGRFISNDLNLDALSNMLREAPRVLKPDSWLAVFCSPKRHAESAALLESCGFPIRGEVIWDKVSPGLGGGIRYQHETILLCAHGKPSGKSSLFSVVRCHVTRVGGRNRHPHEKPVPLMNEIIKYCSKEGGVVLDPFAGSGSTLVSCIKTGRMGIGVECEPKYENIAKLRIEQAGMPLFAEQSA